MTDAPPSLLVLNVQRLGRELRQHLRGRHQVVRLGLGVVLVEQLEAGVLHGLGLDVVVVRLHESARRGLAQTLCKEYLSETCRLERIEM